MHFSIKTFILILGLSSSFKLMAFSFSPMGQTIRLDRQQKQVQFQIDNNSAEAIPILISATKRIQLPDGSEEHPETNLLSVFPPQMIIPAGQRRTIRVQWLGGQLEEEQAFRIIAEQVPVDLDPENNENRGIQMLLRYMAALYVSPGNVSSDLKLKSYAIENGEIVVTLKNSGKRHQMLDNPRLIFEREQDRITLSPSDLPMIDGQNVLAGSKRIFHIPNTQNIGPNFKASIRVD